MSKEGERGTGPLGDSKGGIPDLSGAVQSDTGICAEAPQSIVIDASVLASIINQARSPILDGLHHQLIPFAIDGIVEVEEWLVAYERLCRVEYVVPMDLLIYMLASNAMGIYSRMTVGKASDCPVVKAVLTAKYAIPRQAACCSYVNCRLEASETVDVYLSCLEQLGGRLGLTLNDLVCKVKF